MRLELERHAVTLNGHRVAFRLAGAGPVVVLVHGMTSSSDAWIGAGGLLADQFTVVAPDLLGHGETAKPPGDYSLGAHATFLRDLLLVLGHERATFVGHSFGGGVAMQFAYQFPERCERLVLVGSGGLGREVNPLLRALALPAAELVLPLGCHASLVRAGAAVARWMRALGFGPTPAAEEVWRAYSSLADRDSRAAFLRTLRGVVDVAGQSVSAVDRLPLAANVPTLIVWGEQDRIIPLEHGRRANGAIAGSRLEIFPDAGHFPHCESPERFAQVVMRFIASTEPACVSQVELGARLRAGTG